MKKELAVVLVIVVALAVALYFVLPGLLVMGAAWLISSYRRPVGNPQVPEPVRPVDLERYLGGWYEIGRYDTKFERGCEGVTADYSFRSDGLIRVLKYWMIVF